MRTLEGRLGEDEVRVVVRIGIGIGAEVELGFWVWGRCGEERGQEVRFCSAGLGQGRCLRKKVRGFEGAGMLLT